MTKTISRNTIFLFLFALSCVLIPFAIKANNTSFIVFLRVIRIVFLILYYISSTKKYNYLFIISLIPFLISGVFFVYDTSSIYGMFTLILSRILLLKIVIPKKKKIDWKLFTGTVSLFLALGGIVLSLFYSDTFLFYISATTGLVLSVLLSITFMNLLIYKRKMGSTEMFLAIFIFVISDLVFGIQKIHETNQTNMMMSSIFYNIAYFLICKSLILKEKNDS